MSCFPASQPTNIRFVDIVTGDAVYVPNILSFGEGKVRVFYERFSRAEGDLRVCYKDYDFITDFLGEEYNVMIKKADGTIVPYATSVIFEYLEENGYTNHINMFGQNSLAVVLLFVMMTAMFTVQQQVNMQNRFCIAHRIIWQLLSFFAVYPEPAQYESEYRFLDGKIYSIYRTDCPIDNISYSTSEDGGKTWSAPVRLKNKHRLSSMVAIRYVKFGDLTK